MLHVGSLFAGIASNGHIWRLPMSAHRMSATVYGSWVTPTASDTKKRRAANPVMTRNGTWRHVGKDGKQSFLRLSQVLEWATPTATNANQGAHSTNNAGKPLLPMQAAMSGDESINPDWVEQLMGFPEGWTSLAE